MRKLLICITACFLVLLTGCSKKDEKHGKGKGLLYGGFMTYFLYGGEADAPAVTTAVTTTATLRQQQCRLLQLRQNRLQSLL